MKNGFARMFSLVIGIIVLICGISLLFTPLEAYIMVSFFVPFAIFFNGVSGIVGYFANKKTQEVSGWLLADGILGLIIGIWLLFRPAGVALALPFVFGFWVLFGGILRIVGSIAMRKVNDKWGWILVSGVIGAVTGFFLLNHPLLSGVIIAYLVAWSFVLTGIQGIMNYFVLKDEGTVS